MANWMKWTIGIIGISASSIGMSMLMTIALPNDPGAAMICRVMISALIGWAGGTLIMVWCDYE